MERLTHWWQDGGEAMYVLLLLGIVGLSVAVTGIRLARRRIVLSSLAIVLGVAAVSYVFVVRAQGQEAAAAAALELEQVDAEVVAHAAERERRSLVPFGIVMGALPILAGVVGVSRKKSTGVTIR